MPTTKECRHNAEICLMLASETTEIYAKTALIELATEFRALAELSMWARYLLNVVNGWSVLLSKSDLYRVPLIRTRVPIGANRWT